jgi:hypothetical protein
VAAFRDRTTVLSRNAPRKKACLRRRQRKEDHLRLIEHLKAEPLENDIVFAPGETISPESLAQKAKDKEGRPPVLETS